VDVVSGRRGWIDLSTMYFFLLPSLMADIVIRAGFISDLPNY
jgi:hypothetical protein